MPNARVVVAAAVVSLVLSSVAIVLLLAEPGNGQKLPPAVKRGAGTLSHCGESRIRVQRDGTPVLRIGVRYPDGRCRRLRQELWGISTDTFAIADSGDGTVSLRWPKKERCARIDYSLEASVSEETPLDRARALISSSGFEEQAKGLEGTTSEIKNGSPVQVSAWKKWETIVKSSYLAERAVLVYRARGPRSYPDTLLELRLRATMLSYLSRCGGTNSFTLGPGFDNPIHLIRG